MLSDNGNLLNQVCRVSADPHPKKTVACREVPPKKDRGVTQCDPRWRKKATRGAYFSGTLSSVNLLVHQKQPRACDPPNPCPSVSSDPLQAFSLGKARVFILPRGSGEVFFCLRRGGKKLSRLFLFSQPNCSKYTFYFYICIKKNLQS